MSSYAASLNPDAPVGRTSAATTDAARAGLCEEVREFEFAWGVAYIRRDTAALEQILADDYTFTDPLGGVTDKRQNLDYISSGMFVIEDTHSRDVCVRIYGETAVVTRSRFSKRVIRASEFRDATSTRMCSSGDRGVGLPSLRRRRSHSAA